MDDGNRSWLSCADNAIGDTTARYFSPSRTNERTQKVLPVPSHRRRMCAIPLPTCGVRESKETNRLTQLRTIRCSLGFKVRAWRRRRRRLPRCLHAASDLMTRLSVCSICSGSAASRCERMRMSTCDDLSNPLRDPHLANYNRKEKWYQTPVWNASTPSTLDSHHTQGS